MRLFVFSLLLAVAVVVLSSFFFDASTGLRQHLLWVLSSTIGGFAFIGLIIAFFESRRDRIRQQKRQSYLRAPSKSLRATKPAPMGPASSASITGPSIAFGDNESPEPPPTPAPVVAELEEQQELVSATHTPDNGISTQSATAFQTVDQEPVAETPDLSAAVEEAAEAVEASDVAKAEASEEQADDKAQEEARTPADQVLYLARDFEFSEVKRVLNLWQMSFDEANNASNILGRWISDDGTLVEVLNDKDGTPVIEIRGPMADELAEFLPQDLPVYPSEPQGTELT